MKIIVISDSHGEYSLIEKILEKENDATYFIHCGDFEILSYFLNRFIIVKGNCDYENIPREINIEIENKKIHIEHGNNLDQEKIINNNYDICLSGHTHKKNAQKIENTLFLNPGSLSQPRDSNNGSYLEIKIDNNYVTYKFKEIDLTTNKIL